MLEINHDNLIIQWFFHCLDGLIYYVKILFLYFVLNGMSIILQKWWIYLISLYSNQSSGCVCLYQKVMFLKLIRNTFLVCLLCDAGESVIWLILSNIFSFRMWLIFIVFFAQKIFEGIPKQIQCKYYNPDLVANLTCTYKPLSWKKAKYSFDGHLKDGVVIDNVMVMIFFI